jgi:type VI secretion system protein ImpC
MTASLARQSQPLTETGLPSLLDELLEGAGYKREDQSCWNILHTGLDELLRDAVAAPQARPIDADSVAAMIADLDDRLSRQLDAILHHEKFQRLEAAWREVRYLADHAARRAGEDGGQVQVVLLDVTKEELHRDLRGQGPIDRTQLFRKVYTPYDQLGGEPYGAVCTGFEFTYSSSDIELLKRMAVIGEAAHAPILANVGPEMFGCKDYKELVARPDLSGLKGPEYIQWQSFRDSDQARYVGLCLPRFLLRRPYGRDNERVESFDFDERVHGGPREFVWGHASVAIAASSIESFLKNGWCVNIIGPKAGGAVEDLPIYTYEALGKRQARCPLEVAFRESQAVEFEQAGFIPMEYELESDRACFFSAASAQAPRRFANTPEGKIAESNFRIGAQLPYLFIACRFAHYLKVFHRAEIGTAKTPRDIQAEQTKWLGQFVVANDAGEAIRAKKPLRRAEVIVEEIPGRPGSYRSRIELVPYFRVHSMDITLSLVSRTRQEKKAS